MEHEWMKSLPAEYAVEIVPPVKLETFADPSACSEKSHGYDSANERCFYQHAYAVTTERFNDDDDFTEVVTYFEKARAWRLKDGRWLTYLFRGGEEGDCRERAAPASYAVKLSNPFR
ncbi:MAG: hypothetical protein LLG15_12575 [Betaproteobacteria bacterium]|nr:hypothetical protein [Betaproteobacteria bacterium]